MKKAILLISLLVAVCATTTPVQKRPDGSVTINTSTLKASEGIISNVQAGIACYLESKGKGGD